MKHFQIPFDAVQVHPWAAIRELDPMATAQPLSFLRWATIMWLDDPRAFTVGQGQSIVKMRRWQKVIDRFEAAKPGDWISLDDEDFTTLKGIVESPNRLMQVNHTQMALAAMPYVDAVLGAVDQLPATSVTAAAP